MSDVMGFIEAAAAEVPEAVGKALTMLGDEISKLGTALEALAARMDAAEAHEAKEPPESA
jgi:hypothetical protein